MKSAPLEFLHMAAAIFIFCTASLFLLSSNALLTSELRIIREEITKKEILYEQPIDEIQNKKISYEELVGVMQGDIGYTVVIDGVTYDMDTYNSSEFDFSVIAYRDYTKAYEYDSDGQIAKVIYN